MFNKLIEKKYDLKRNQVTNKVLFKLKKENEYRELDSIAFNTILLELEKKGYKISPQKFDMYLYSDLVTSFDPFKEYY
jgi:hypothetical protein